jgi:hypothetical protein
LPWKQDKSSIRNEKCDVFSLSLLGFMSFPNFKGRYRENCDLFYSDDDLSFLDEFREKCCIIVIFLEWLEYFVYYKRWHSK